MPLTQQKLNIIKQQEINTTEDIIGSEISNTDPKLLDNHTNNSNTENNSMDLENSSSVENQNNIPSLNATKSPSEPNPYYPSSFDQSNASTYFQSQIPTNTNFSNGDPNQLYQVNNPDFDAQAMHSGLTNPIHNVNGNNLIRPGFPYPSVAAPQIPNPLNIPQSLSQQNLSMGNQRQIIRKPWHTIEDNIARHTMVQRIISLLQNRRPNGTLDWQQKLPQMAKRLEDALYSNANSLEEYQDLNTLKTRLQQYAVSMGKNKPAAQQMQPSSSMPPGVGVGVGVGLGVGVGVGVGVPLQPNYPMNTQHPSIVSISRPPGVGMLGPQPGSGIASMQNLQSNNPMPMPIKSDLFSSEDVAKIQDNNLMGQQTNFGSGIDKSEENKQLMNGSLDNNSGKAFGNLARSEEHRKQVLKQQQQRLLLLRHASKCPHDNCLVTQHCANMKLLWKHIMSCKEHECKVPHCVSSRYVLSHYSKCKEPNCPVCGPVREAIRRNHEKTQSILNLSKLPPLSLKTEGENTGEPKAKKAKSEAAIAKAAAAKAVKAAAKAKSEEGVDKGEAKLDESGKVKKRINKKQKAEGDAEGTGVIQPPSKTGPKPKDKKILPQGVIDSSQVPRPAPPPQVITKATALDPVSCAVYGFSNQQIESHIKNIHEGMRMTSSEIRNLCMPIVDGLLKHPSGYIFAYPVDPVALGILDYFEIVKMPMDLGTIKKRLEQSQYRDPHHVAGDVQLVFDNAILYNPKENDYHKVAQQLKKSADNQFKQAIALHEKKIEEMRKHPDACNLCGESNVKFEPPVYYCQGKCGGQRIRRNAYYYSTTNNLNHWCSPCFSDMKENVPIVLPDMTIYKADLLASKKKHQEESEESWVECNICKRWVHQICGLFNSRRNISEEVIFVCPVCLLEKRKKSGEDIVFSSKKMRALDLPHTNLSQFIQRKVEERLQQAYADRAALTNRPISEVDRCPEICIRQVASIDKHQLVRDGVRERYKDKNYPTEFPCRTKCIILFQNIDGQDVILFGMYLYEYGHKCPQPNQRRVYVSYLDSVHYFRPRHYRTIVYQEIIIAYLEYVKSRGFHTAHIWACPPLKGDDYILYCHPQDQKTPKDDRLRQWYVDVLKNSLERGIVCQITDLYTEFLANPNNDATCLPYFEGDYWVNEAEVIIKDLAKSTGTAKLVDNSPVEEVESGAKSKSKSQPKRTRSSKGDLTAQATGTKNRDPVMAKLAAIIQPMKDAFFVARLHPVEYAEKWSNVRLEEMEVEAKEKDPESESKRAKLMEESALTNESSQETVIKEETSQSQIESEAKESENNNISSDDTDNKPIVKSESRANLEANSSSEDKSSNMTEKKLKDDTEDVDDVQENDYFNTRQDCLQLCQGNHYQFDQLRRAKHTSMMILYHLHNPDAPKFVPTCTLCHKEILIGYRHRCETCDIDICHNCITTKGHPSSIHPHPLRPMAVSGAAPAQLTDEQRRERQRSIEMHLHLLKHASSCENKECKSKNCLKMKEFIKHGQTCPTSTKGGCPICKRIYNLLTLHARSCRVENCQVHKCHEIREVMRQNEMRQQQMDDRRRAMMNKMYNQASAPAAEPDDP